MISMVATSISCSFIDNLRRDGVSFVSMPVLSRRSLPGYSIRRVGLVTGTGDPPRRPCADSVQRPVAHDWVIPL
jgi:hypothetical protein